MLDLTTLPNFCSHEHWGSLTSFTMEPEGFRNDVVRGARPVRPHSLLDILLDPYLGGWLAAGGTDFGSVPGDDPVAALMAVRELAAPHELTGAYQCVRRGVHFCYGLDLRAAGPEEIARGNAECADAYRDPFSWYRLTMARARMSALIRPVHPEYFARVDSAESARAEEAVNHPILRVDPLLELWPAECPRRDGLAELAGVDPVDAASWRAFLDRIFEIARDGNCVGSKQLQAYTRDLDFEPRGDDEVRFRGDLAPREVRAFQDWVMNECYARTNDLGWPHQCHVGTHNHPRSNPLPLEHAARRYPRQAIVMLHCWPYLSEAAYLAKQFPNMHIDACWQAVLNPQFLRRSLREWLGYVPTHKMQFAHDATSIEMAVGSMMFTREILAEELWTWGGSLGIGERRLVAIAADLLHNNAVRLYRRGEEAAP